MAIKTQTLCGLIATMAAAEKAYFKKFGFKREGAGQQKMLAMFELCEKYAKNAQPQDWDALFAKAGIEQVALTRNRLFNALLASLRDYGASASNEDNLYHQYRNADILINRGFLKEAHQILEKAIVEADSLDMVEFALLLEQKRHVVLHGLGQRKKVSENLARRGQLADALSSQMYLAAMYEEVYQLQVEKGRYPSHETREHLLDVAEKVANKTLPKNDIKSQIMQCNILHNVYFNLSDNQKSLEYSTKIIAAFNAHPNFKASRIRQYVLSLYNYLSDCLNNGETSLYKQGVGEMDALVKDYPTLAEEARRLYYSLELDFLLMAGATAEVEAFFVDFEPWLKAVHSHMPINILLDLTARTTYLCYIIRDYDKTLDHVIAYLQRAKGGLRLDHDLQMNLLEVATHFETGNPELAAYKHTALMQRYRPAIAASKAIHNYMKCLGALLSPTRKKPIANIVANAVANHPTTPEPQLLINPKLLLERLGFV